ncbi:MAG: hypothetical protein WCC92_09010 [Candidatus Korobacteraceae bacterium]
MPTGETDPTVLTHDSIGLARSTFFYDALEIDVKARLMIVLSITGMLLGSVNAQESSSVQNSNRAMAPVQQQPHGKPIRPPQTQVPPESRDAEGHPQPSSANAGDTIVINVWSSAKSVGGPANEMERKQLSTDFAASALTAACRMQSTERKIENSIRRGFPLGEFWIQSDLEGVDDSLRLAALSVTNDADRQALQQLEGQNSRLQAWTDWLMDANRKMQLGDYYMSASALDNDTRFQSGVACTKFLVSMLASRRLADDNSCL